MNQQRKLKQLYRLDCINAVLARRNSIINQHCETLDFILHGSTLHDCRYWNDQLPTTLELIHLAVIECWHNSICTYLLVSLIYIGLCNKWSQPSMVSFLTPVKQSLLVIRYCLFNISAGESTHSMTDRIWTDVFFLAFGAGVQSGSFPFRVQSGHHINVLAHCISFGHTRICVPSIPGNRNTVIRMR